MELSTTEVQKTLNVLIVEDEGDISLILNVMLKKDDVNIEHVNTLAKADAYIKENTVDVVILDNRLPDGLGMDYIPTLKTEKPSLKIVMITGNADEGAKETALQKGADIFLAKPFTKEQIKTALTALSGYVFTDFGA